MAMVDVSRGRAVPSLGELPAPAWGLYPPSAVHSRMDECRGRGGDVDQDGWVDG